MIAIDSLQLGAHRSAAAIIEDITARITDAGMKTVDVNATKPWGGYIRLADDFAVAFADQFFANAGIDRQAMQTQPISPKFLLVAPHQRLSWQRHERRSELWRFLTDGGAYSVSDDPDSQPITETSQSSLATIGCGQCHRLLSVSDNYVLVAEIWQHTDANRLSDEEDIERLEDDYNR
jgi:mannose-6-phosphate isomerase-like protein (cupin superfamily)